MISYAVRKVFHVLLPCIWNHPFLSGLLRAWIGSPRCVVPAMLNRLISMSWSRPVIYRTCVINEGLLNPTAILAVHLPGRREHVDVFAARESVFHYECRVYFQDILLPYSHLDTPPPAHFFPAAVCSLLTATFAEQADIYNVCLLNPYTRNCALGTDRPCKKTSTHNHNTAQVDIDHYEDLILAVVEWLASSSRGYRFNMGKTA